MNRGRPSPLVLRIEGRSGSGKTTLILRLVPRLRARGLRVACVKGSHHTPVLQPREKDSARMRAVGADAVAVGGPRLWAILGRSRGRPPLAELLRCLPRVDLVLVEGYRASRIGSALRWKERRNRLAILEREILERLEARRRSARSGERA